MTSTDEIVVRVERCAWGMGLDAEVAVQHDLFGCWLELGLYVDEERAGPLELMRLNALPGMLGVEFRHVEAEDAIYAYSYLTVCSDATVHDDEIEFACAQLAAARICYQTHRDAGRDGEEHVHGAGQVTERIALIPVEPRQLSGRVRECLRAQRFVQ